MSTRTRTNGKSRKTETAAAASRYRKEVKATETTSVKWCRRESSKLVVQAEAICDDESFERLAAAKAESQTAYREEFALQKASASSDVMLQLVFIDRIDCKASEYHPTVEVKIWNGRSMVQKALTADFLHGLFDHRLQIERWLKEVYPEYHVHGRSEDFYDITDED